MQPRGEETREKILLAASKLFAKSGYEATGVAEICQLAGISKGGFYHHFQSKQAIFLVLLEDWMSRLEKSFSLIQQQPIHVPQAILQMTENVSHAIKETDAQLSLFLEFWTQAYRDPEIWQITIAPYRRFRDYFTNLVERGIQEKSFRKINPEVGANIIVSLALGMLLQRIFDPNSVDWETEMLNNVSLMLEGLSRSEA